MSNKLTEIRNSKKINQSNLANIMNVSQQTLSSWEVGRTLPKPYQMQHLEDVLGVKKEEIFFDDFNYKTKLEA